MTPVPSWFRYLSYLMGGLFLVCVGLQYNDPDPALWMATYGAGALTSFLLPARKPVVVLAAVLGVATAAWAIYLVYSVWGQVGVADLTGKMSEKGGAVEVGREAGGLGIMAVWLLAAAGYRQTRA